MHADIDTVKVVVKNVPDYAAGKEKNDLGFLTFDLQVGKINSSLAFKFHVKNLNFLNIVYDWRNLTLLFLNFLS